MPTSHSTVTPNFVVHQGFQSNDLLGLIVPDRHSWNPRQLRDLTSTVAKDLAGQLGEIIRYESPQRWWARLAVTSGVELWLLTWLPGQHTEPHDHGGASGSFTVLSGQMHEEYRYPKGPIRTASHPTGKAIGFGAGHAHQMRNRSYAPAATVHAYSPPAVPTREYPSLHDIPDAIPPLPARTSFDQVLADTLEP